MDSRIALAANTHLQFQNKEGGSVRYTIIKEIGRGGSCIVYDAYYETNAGDRKYVRVKECYPAKMRIERTPNGCLSALQPDDHSFEAAKRKFQEDFRLGNGLFYADGMYDALTTTIDTYLGNGTVYLVSVYSPEFTLATYRPKDLHSCITLVKQVAQVIGRMHSAGFLYLDTKPGNILVIDSYTTRIQLFDLDSLIPLDSQGRCSAVDLRNTRVSFSKGFAPIELQTGKIRKLGRHTDVYGVGALLFYLLFGRPPAAADCEMNAVFDFQESKYPKDYQDKLLFALTDFFHNALANFYLDRYPDMETVISTLIVIEKLSDPEKPYIRSSTIMLSTEVIGRRHEIQSLVTWFEEGTSPCVFVTGMGGIGKSTLVRAFLIQQAASIDNLLYLTFSGSLQRTLADDTTAYIRAVEKSEKESQAEYYYRKLRAFRELAAGTASVLVIDNYSGEIDQELAEVIAVGWKVILISRKSPLTNAYAEIPVSALADRNDLYRLFVNNLGSALQPTDHEYLDNIISRIDGHTLVLELIAKQISSSYLSVADASALADTYGFSAIGTERVIYSKDADVCPETLREIITALFDANHLSEQMKSILKVMSLLDCSGIDICFLHDILSIKSKDDANTLARDGWLTLNDKRISLHPVIQETVHCWQWSDQAKAYAVTLMKYLFRELRAEEHREDYPQKLLLAMEISQEVFKKFPCLKRWFEPTTDRQGDMGEIVRRRYERCTDRSPADRKKIMHDLKLSEGILSNCRREPVLLEESIYYDLLYVTITNMPRHREDFILERAEELLSDPRIRNGFAIMKLYDCILSIYQEKKDFAAAEAVLTKAKIAAKKCDHNYVWARYYDLLSHFYDHALGGAYDAVEDTEEILRSKLLDAINKTIRYAGRTNQIDSKHLLVENLLAKATILIRSESPPQKQIDKLLSKAEKIMLAETQPYARVRHVYYLTKAWYATLIALSLEETLFYLHKAAEISAKTVSADLDMVDDLLIPCADMMCCWEEYAYAVNFLKNGIELCEQKDTSIPYIRKKVQLYGCLLDVCALWKKQKLCRSIIEEIDRSNHQYLSDNIYYHIPEEIRQWAFSGEGSHT